MSKSEISGDRYVGVKFRTALTVKDVSSVSGLHELAYWCKQFDHMGLAPPYEYEDGTGSSGNLSFRVPSTDAFMITPAKTSFRKLSAADFVRVTGCDVKEQKIFCEGMNEPSSESFMHCLIYMNRPDVQSIFHGHDQGILSHVKTLDVVMTKSAKSYGTLDLAYEVLKVLGSNNYVVLRGHGFLSMGSSMQDAGELAIRMHEKALDMSESEHPAWDMVGRGRRISKKLLGRLHLK